MISLPASADEGLVDSYRMSRIADQGNKSYHEGMYERARASYMRAKDLADEKGLEAQRLHFNIGGTFYKEGKYDEAAKEFEQVVSASDPSLRERAYYNLGNVNFQKGLAAKDIKLLEEAVGNYQRALELDPDDEEAKFNIEVVRRLIKMQKEQKNPSCNNPNDQPGSPQDQKPGEQKSDQQKADSEDQGGEKKKPDEQKPGEPQDQKPGEPKPEDQKPDEPKPADGATAAKPEPADETKQPEGTAQPPQEISPEEAKRLLQAIREKEKDQMKENMKAVHGTVSGREKDW